MFVAVGMSESNSQAATCGVGVLSVVMTLLVVCYCQALIAM